MTDFSRLGVAAIRDGVADGAFKAVEVAEALNARVSAAKALNAFILETPEKAIDAAQAVDADRAAGKPLGKMAGVPIGMKDLFCTEGVQTTAASHILEGFVPTYESTVSANLWKAGAGMLGKLNMDQFAMGSSNETRRQQCRACARWIVRRFVIRHCRAAVPCGDGNGHWRLDSSACGVRGH